MAYCFIKQHDNVPGTMWCECGSLVAGTPIDGYNVISYLGHGTSGDVYLAEQAALNNRKVVIKIAHRSWSQSDIDNFRHEAALLASLSHPYILPIYGYGVIYERQSSKSVIPSLVSGQALRGAKDLRAAEPEILPLRFPQGFGLPAQDDKAAGFTYS